MIDRLVHHAEIINLKGDSYRLKGRDIGRGPPTMNAETMPEIPLRHDAVTIPCPRCGAVHPRPQTPLLLQRLQSGRLPPPPPAAARPSSSLRARPRKPVTVDECDACGTRALGEQRCDDCGTFIRRIGLGGALPALRRTRRRRRWQPRHPSHRHR